MTSIIPAFAIGGLIRPELTLDDFGRIVLFGAAADFAATYGLKALYAGCPPGTPYPPTNPFLTTPIDTNAGANSVAEGASANTAVGITASSTSLIGPVHYSLVGDTSGGGFKINTTTGVVTVNDPTKIDFESAPLHAYAIIVRASDGILTSNQTFTIAVSDVAPSAPVDTNAGANTVAEGAAAGTAVGITAHSTDINGGALTYALTADSSGGGFKIDANTGVITVNDPSKIDFESTAPGHTYSVTVRASDGTLTSSQSFVINVSDVPLPTPTDANAAANTVAEGAAVGTQVGITASALDPNGPTTSYSLTGDTSGGGFTINAATGIVTVADPTKLDFESAPGHAYSITVKADNGITNSSQSFSIAVTDVAPSAPVDSNAAANTVTEGAAAGTGVGITASSTDVNGPAVTFALIGDTSGGGFTINATTGVVTVADPTKIDYESSGAGHSYTVTAQASDGTLASSQTFTIAVNDVAPQVPVDSNVAANAVVEGAAVGTTVGVTASSTDVNGPAVTYSLVGDTSGGGFTINATTGIVTVADPTKIDYESAPGHAYTVTAQASDGTLTSSQTFTIAVNDAAPSAPVDANAGTNTIAEGAAAGSTVGITASSTDVNGPAVTYSLIGDTSGGGFTINATTGVVTVADPTKIDYESAPGHAYTVTAQASDGTLASSQTFSIGVTDFAPTPPSDNDPATNTVAEGAANGTTVGVTAISTDVNGPAVTYSLTGDTSGGGFTINATTGVVTVADSTKIDFEAAPSHAYSITVQSSDGTLTNSGTISIAVSDVAPSVPIDNDATANSVAEGAAVGSTVGVTIASDDVNTSGVTGLTYSLTADSSGGGFTINGVTGVITVADPTKINFESSGGSYSVTAQASDGTLTSSQTFTINVTDVAPSTPVDSNAAANAISEGASNGSTVGVTASATDVNGPAVTYSLTGDTSGGGFTINATTGVVTVADFTKIDFESSGGSYTVTAQASDGTLASTQTFTIAVNDVAPSVPVDSNGATNRVAVSAPNGSAVGVTASSTDVNGPAVTYSLVADTSGGGFTVNAATGVVTVADSSKIIYNAGSPTYDVTVDASDGTLHAQQTFTINVVLDDPPSVTAGNTIAYTENDAATTISPALTLTDTDNANLVSATVQVTGNYVNGQDILSFVDTATITGSFNAATGLLTLTGTDTVANYQAALQSVKYFNNSDNPSGASRTVTFTANDGTLDSAPATTTINVTPVDDAPVVTAGHTLSYTENQAATAFDSLITVTDVDNTTLTAATVQITGNYANGQDVLAFVNTANITGSFNAATGMLTLSGTDTVANYQAALQSVTYINTSENPSGLTRTVTVIANDGSTTSTPVTGTINVTPVNDAPATTAGGTLNYTENQAASVIDASVTVSDVDSTNLSSATVQITGNYVNGQDVLSFTNQNGITGSFNAATGTMTLTGSSSVANYQTALETVRYFNNSDNPSGLDRTVSYTVNDGSANSNISTSTIHVTPVNDSPVVTATGTLAYTENQAATAVAPALTVSDADNANLTSATVQITGNFVSGEDLLAFTNTANITGSFNSSTGALTLTGTDTVANYQAALRSVTYTDSSENPSTSSRTVTFTVDDGQATNHQSAGSDHTITVASVDDAPLNNGVPSSFTVSSGFTHTVAGLSIADVDAGSFNDITTTFTAAAGTVTIGNGTSGGTAGISGGATVTTNASGSVVLTGTVGQINASLAGSNVVYTAADNAGNTATTLQMTTNDHGHTGTGGPLSDTDTINIGVIPQVWFINQDQSTLDSTATRGSQTNPFTSVDEFNASSGPGVNDYIYVKAGTYNGEGINLKTGQTLLGDDQALSFIDPLGGPNIVIEDATGARPTINVTASHATDQGIALASGNTVAGIIVTTNAAGQVGIDDSGASVGNLNISSTDVTGSGQAINLTHGGTGGAVTLGTVSSSGGSVGIALGGALVTTFSATGGTLSGHSVSEFSINGGNATVSYGGTIGDGTGLSASIANRSGGTVTLSGNINDGNDAGGGISLSANSGTTINFTGTTKTLNTGAGDGVSANNNSGSTVNFTNGGLDIDTTSGTGFNATVSGTYTVSGTGNTINTTSGTALNLSSLTVGASGITFDSATTTSAANGILIDTVTGGAITINGGSIAGASSHGVDINAAQNNITIASSITSTAAGRSVEVTNSGKVGGNTITFSGAVTDPGLGINLDNNDQNTNGATVNFTGALNVDATTHTGFNATNGGTVNVTNSANSITTTTGTAVNIQNTTIGSSNVTFHDVSANGGANGIVLDTTGSSGGFHLTGNGTNVGATGGGVIQNMTGGDGTTAGTGIYLNNTHDVQLNGLQMNGFTNYGVRGLSVDGVALTNTTISGTSGNNNLFDEAAVAFGTTGGTTGITGTGTFTNLNVRGGFENNLQFFQTSGTSSLTFTNLSSHDTKTDSPSFGADGFLLETQNSANSTVVIQGSNFANNFTQGVQANALDSSTLNMTVKSSTFTSNNEGVVLANSGSGHLTATVGGSAPADGNTVTGQIGVGIFVGNAGTLTTSATLVGAIRNNTVTQAVGHNNDAILSLISGPATASPSTVLDISNNTATTPLNGDGGGFRGIFVDTPDTGTSPTFDVTVNNNTVSTQGLGADGIALQARRGNGDFHVQGNTSTSQQGDAIFVRQVNSDGGGNPSTFDLEKGISAAGTVLQVIKDNNPAVTGAATHTIGISGTINLVANGAVTTVPLLAAAGGVQASSPTPGETHLTQAQLDTVVAAAIAQWAAAGASAAQLAALHATTFSVANLDGAVIGNESAPNHITIDTDAAGHGWFVDATPNDNSEFTHAANAGGTDLYTDTTNAAAGHLDLLTAVAHEMGHVLGLSDQTTASSTHDLMYANLVDGERRLPSAADVASVQPPALPPTATIQPASSPGTQPIVAAPFVVTMTGTATADTFVFNNIDIHASVPPPVAHVAGYSFIQGDTFNFSALTSQFHGWGVDDASVVRAVADPSGKFATLQVNASLDTSMVNAHWVSIAQIDGAHAGDHVKVLIDSQAGLHHADLLI